MSSEALRSAIEALRDENKRCADLHGSFDHRTTVMTPDGLVECRAYEEMYRDFATILTEILEETESA